MAKRKRTYSDTTVPPIAGSFEDGLRALLAAGPAPDHVGKRKRKVAKRKTAKRKAR